LAGTGGNLNAFSDSSADLHFLAHRVAQEPEPVNITFSAFALGERVSNIAFLRGSQTVNFADYPVAIELGGQREMIKSNGITDIEGKLESDQYYDKLMISLPKEEKPKRAFQGQIYFSSEQRMLYFVYQKTNSRPGTIKLSGITETIRSETPPAK